MVIENRSVSGSTDCGTKLILLAGYFYYVSIINSPEALLLASLVFINSS